MTRIRSFVEGTQHGFAFGLRRVKPDGTDGPTLIERFVNDKGGTAIDAAYKEASQGAASFLSTWKRRPDLIRRRPDFLG